MSRSNRRQFLKTTAAASAVFGTFTIGGTKASGRVIGANDTIRIGVAGINGRGGAHIGEFAGRDKVQVTYLIDPDSRLFESRSKNVEAKGGNTPKCVQDIREALEDDNLDAISVATTNHWHSLITIWACQAGKDVYVEKPISHNVFEGRQCVEAAKKYGRVVQHGTQNRSSGGLARQMAAIHAGKYGKLLVSKGYCCKPRWSIGSQTPGDAPKGLDFNLWLGPAPKQPYHGNLVHYNWHWFWDTGNGDIGNQGVHEIDIARWAIKDATLPTSVWSLGGRFIPGEKQYHDQGQTPNMQMAVFEYGDTLLLFEVRGLVGKKDVPSMVTNEFYTSEGVIKGGKFTARDGGKTYDVEVPEVDVTPGGAFGAFITAMRSRKPEDNNADAETAHYSAALCHLANASFRLGEPQPFGMKAKALGDNKEVVESFESIRENLKAVDVKLDETTYMVGPKLAFDPKTEQFTGDRAAAANQLITREYREPFVVPKEV
jgi:predicted dehydrogenase